MPRRSVCMINTRQQIPVNGWHIIVFLVETICGASQYLSTEKFRQKLTMFMPHLDWFYLNARHLHRIALNIIDYIYDY